MTVLLDTGVLFAFLNAQDVNHRQAKALMVRIAKKEFGAPFVTDHVVDELFVLIRVRTRSAALERSARSLLPLPNPSLKGLTSVSLGTDLVPRAWEVFDRYRDHKISFTDAGLLVTMKELKIEYLATLDARLRGIAQFAK